jgi:hypothetical protein
MGKTERVTASEGRWEGEERVAGTEGTVEEGEEVIHAGLRARASLQCTRGSTLDRFPAAIHPILSRQSHVSSDLAPQTADPAPPVSLEKQSPLVSTTQSTPMPSLDPALQQLKSKILPPFSRHLPSAIPPCGGAPLSSASSRCWKLDTSSSFSYVISQGP